MRRTSILAAFAALAIMLAAAGVARGAAVRLPVPASGTFDFSIGGVDGNYVELGADARLRIRPHKIIVRFEDGAFQFRHVRWSGWGGYIADGRGQVRVCSADVGCPTWGSGARVALGSPRDFSCASGARVRLYTRLVLRTPRDRVYLILGHPAYQPSRC